MNSNTESCKKVKALDCVSCYYEYYNCWWIGLVLEKYDQQEDLHSQFMHFHGPSPSSVRPFFQDICWVPNNLMLCKIDIPTTKTNRSFLTSEANIINICPKLTNSFVKQSYFYNYIIKGTNVFYMNEDI